jgi:WD40 repeat protein
MTKIIYHCRFWAGFVGILLLAACGKSYPQVTLAENLAEETQPAETLTTVVPLLAAQTTAPAFEYSATAAPALTLIPTATPWKVKGQIFFVIGGLEGSRNRILFINENGQILKQFLLPAHPDWYSLSYDGSYLAYGWQNTFSPVILDTETYQRVNLMKEGGCKAGNWADSSSRLALICVDGVHFYRLDNSEWKLFFVYSTEEIIPPMNNSALTNFPIWWNNDQNFGFFLDMSSYNPNPVTPIDQFYKISLEEDAAGEYTSKDYSKVKLEEGIDPRSIVLVNPDQSILAVNEIGGGPNLDLLDIETGKLIEKKQVSPEGLEISSFAWSPDGKDMAFTLAGDNLLRKFTSSGSDTPINILDCGQYGIDFCHVIAWIKN